MNNSFLAALQLASPALPIGAYSYSEGIEWLVEEGVIKNGADLDRWLRHELCYGSVSLDGRILKLIYPLVVDFDIDHLIYWNNWLSAQRDTEELRYQSWQMGSALIKLLQDMGQFPPSLAINLTPCNYVVAFAITAYHWGISLEESLSIFLFTWSANIISAAIKAIPIGQTEGQKILFDLHQLIQAQTGAILLTEVELESCTIGLGLASMRHETQYSRIFRS
ncbi:MAG: urease accessory protein UreF [Pseudanabaenaceae cyanobacterium SKYGB_i_bin29]|nr:urease accessory protein UreF [Pseudanabaenaceae cyanobacterium SKYG29]MDW8421820.1 urease accessory protein UreF [Pseudanabaenaceae cyanobacterium SKYGB_i_bin29]